MKYLTLVFTLLLLNVSIYSFSQVSFEAGDSLSFYHDINPDTIIAVSCNSVVSNATENYFFDLNGDFQNDIEYLAGCSFALGGQSASRTISALNSNLFFRFGRIDSAYNTYLNFWWVARVAKPLEFGDSINSTDAIWDSTLSVGRSAFLAGSYQFINDWNSLIDKYIGIKYQNSTDTIYGWIRIYGNYLLKDYSFSSTLIGLTEPGIDNYRIYPNPASNKIYVDLINSEEVQIGLFDIVGKQIRPFVNSKGMEIEIDINNLSEGIYLVQIKTMNGTFTKKIIVQYQY